jgi:hypothetical protein
MLAAKEEFRRHIYINLFLNSCCFSVTVPWFTSYFFWDVVQGKLMAADVSGQHVTFVRVKQYSKNLTTWLLAC